MKCYGTCSKVIVWLAWLSATATACHRKEDIAARPQAATAGGPARAAKGDVHHRRASDEIVRKRLNKVKGGLPGKYIVVLEESAGGVPGAQAAAPAEVAARLAARHTFRRTHLFQRVLRGFAAEMSEPEAAALARDPEVAYVVEDVP